MKFAEDWTKENDMDLKNFHECNWDEKCTMCQNFNECEAEKKAENNDKYKVELWVLHKVVDVLETEDFETAKEQYRTWFNAYDNNCNKGHTMLYVNDELKSIEWTHENII